MGFPTLTTRFVMLQNLLRFVGENPLGAFFVAVGIATMLATIPLVFEMLESIRHRLRERGDVRIPRPSGKVGMFFAGGVISAFEGIFALMFADYLIGSFGSWIRETLEIGEELGFVERELPAIPMGVWILFQFLPSAAVGAFSTYFQFKGGLDQIELNHFGARMFFRQVIEWRRPTSEGDIWTWTPIIRARKFPRIKQPLVSAEGPEGGEFTIAAFCKAENADERSGGYGQYEIIIIRIGSLVEAVSPRSIRLQNAIQQLRNILEATVRLDVLTRKPSEILRTRAELNERLDQVMDIEAIKLGWTFRRLDVTDVRRPLEVEAQIVRAAAEGVQRLMQLFQAETYRRVARKLKRAFPGITMDLLAALAAAADDRGQVNVIVGGRHGRVPAGVVIAGAGANP